MSEERIVETRTPTGDTHTTHTVVTDHDHPKKSGAGWLIPLLLLGALIAGFYLFSQKDDADDVAEANTTAQPTSDAATVGPIEGTAQ